MPRPPGGDPDAGRAGLSGEAPPGGPHGMSARRSGWHGGTCLASGAVAACPSSASASLTPHRVSSSASRPLCCQWACPCRCCHGASAACACSQRTLRVRARRPGERVRCVIPRSQQKDTRCPLPRGPPATPQWCIRYRDPRYAVECCVQSCVPGAWVGRPDPATGTVPEERPL